MESWWTWLERPAPSGIWLAVVALGAIAFGAAVLLLFAWRNLRGAQWRATCAMAELEAIERQVYGEKVIAPSAGMLAALPGGEPSKLSKELASLHARLDLAGYAGERSDGFGWLVNALDHALSILEAEAETADSPSDLSIIISRLRVLRRHLADPNYPTLARIPDALVRYSEGAAAADWFAPLFRLDAMLPVRGERKESSEALARAIGLAAAVVRIVVPDAPARPESAGLLAAEAARIDSLWRAEIAERPAAVRMLDAAAARLDTAFSEWIPSVRVLPHVLATEELLSALSTLREALKKVTDPLSAGAVEEVLVRNVDAFDLAFRADLLASTYLTEDELPISLALSLAALAAAARGFLAAGDIVVLSPRLLTGPEDAPPDPCRVSHVLARPLHAVPAIRRRIEAVRGERRQSIQNELRIDCIRFSMQSVRRGTIRTAQVVVFEPREWA